MPEKLPTREEAESVILRKHLTLDLNAPRFACAYLKSLDRIDELERQVAALTKLASSCHIFGDGSKDYRDALSECRDLKIEGV